MDFQKNNIFFFIHKYHKEIETRNFKIPITKAFKALK